MPYPGDIETFTRVVDYDDYYMAAHMNAMQIIAERVQTELGTDPAGIATDVKTRLANSLLVNVKDHGAVGDDDTDDTSAFVAAINEADTNKRDIFVPAGTYKITSTLSIPAGVGLIGEGPFTSIIHYTGAGKALQLYGGTQSPRQATYRVNIEKLAIELPTSGTVTGIYAMGAYVNRYRNIRVFCDSQNTSATGIEFDGNDVGDADNNVGAFYNAVTNCEIGYLGTGIKFTGTYGQGQANSNWVTNCRILVCTTGVHLHICNDITISECTLEQNTKGIYADQRSSRCTVEKCRPERSKIGFDIHASATLNKFVQNYPSSTQEAILTSTTINATTVSGTLDSGTWANVAVGNIVYAYDGVSDYGTWDNNVSYATITDVGADPATGVTVTNWTNGVPKTGTRCLIRDAHINNESTTTLIMDEAKGTDGPYTFYADLLLSSGTTLSTQVGGGASPTTAMTIGKPTQYDVQNLHKIYGRYMLWTFELSSRTGAFDVGEVVTGGTSSATITARRNKTAGADYLIGNITSGTFIKGETLTGGTSGETATFEGADTTYTPYIMNQYGDFTYVDPAAAVTNIINIDYDAQKGYFGTPEYPLQVRGALEFYPPGGGNTTLAADATITPTSSFIRVVGDGAAITLSTTTPISESGVSDGQILTLVGMSDANTVTVPHVAGVCELKASKRVLAKGDVLMLRYVTGDIASWVEEHYTNTQSAVEQLSLDFLNGLAESGTWTPSFNNSLPELARTANNNTTEVFQIQIPLQTSIANGATIQSVEMAYSCDAADTGDDIQVRLCNRTMPADNSAPSAINVIAGDADGDYDDAHNTAAERVDDAGAPEDHTLTMTVPTGDRSQIADGESWFLQIRVVEADDATGALTVIFKDIIVNYENNNS